MSPISSASYKWPIEHRQSSGHEKQDWEMARPMADLASDLSVRDPGIAFKGRYVGRQNAVGLGSRRGGSGVGKGGDPCGRPWWELERVNRAQQKRQEDHQCLNSYSLRQGRCRCIMPAEDRKSTRLNSS